MKRGLVGRRARYVAFALGVAAACAPIARRVVAIAPANACPDHPCAAYASEGGVTCADGACIDTVLAPFTHLVVLVATPMDAWVAPGLTFAVSLPDVAADSGITYLPSSLNFGRYVVSSKNLDDLHGDLGNGARCQMTGACNTPLPVHVTYRPLWYPGSASPVVPIDAGLPLAEAVTIGLALYPIETDTVPPRYPTILGPGGGPDVAFASYVQAGVTYERTLAPDPPFDQTFPPDINRVKFSPGEVLEMPQDDVYGPDFTLKTGPTATFPIFDLSRADGQSLDGWTAYLRDETTKRPISPIKSLSGTTTPDGGLLLPTSHHPQAVGTSLPDALTNAELVMAPPEWQHMPTAVFPAVGPLPRAEVYDFVPPAVTVPGTIAWSDGKPVLADVVFEATGIYAVSPGRAVDPSDAGASGAAGEAGEDGDAGSALPLKTQGFEYVAHVRAQPDTMDPNGTSTYSVVLPRGEYRVSVRPLDVAESLEGGADPGGDAGAPSHGLMVFEKFNTETDNPTRTINPAPVVHGVALVADGRPLSGATVEALPVHCASPMEHDSGTPLPDSPACMPRYAQTTTAQADGSFALVLDPGEYVVRVEPAEGTRLPWVWQMLSVPTSGGALDSGASESNRGLAPVTFSIPAPVHRELQLFDQAGIAVANAIVRLFTVRTSRPAIEVGRAMTDATGRVDVYLDPSVQ